MKDDNLSDVVNNVVSYYNTKEGMHDVARKTGTKAYYLGCSCEECNKEFDKVLDKIVPHYYLSSHNITTSIEDALMAWPNPRSLGIKPDSVGRNGRAIYDHDESKLPTVKFSCDNCGTVTEGYNLCLKCNPQKYEVHDKPDSLLAKHTTALDAYANAIWNKAIETAALTAKEYLNSKGYTGKHTFTNIMRLKK